MFEYFRTSQEVYLAFLRRNISLFSLFVAEHEWTQL